MVVDSSTAVAALIDAGADGQWARQLLDSQDLAAPHLMRVEAANILRRRVLAGIITERDAAFAHAELVALSVELYPFEPFAPRIWELGRTVTAYDAWYVALAEALGVTLATIDFTLIRSPGPRCSFLTPPG